MFVSALTKVQARLNSLRAEDGATAVEYGILVAAIAVAVTAGALVLGPLITSKLSGIL